MEQWIIRSEIMTKRRLLNKAICLVLVLLLSMSTPVFAYADGEILLDNMDISIGENVDLPTSNSENGDEDISTGADEYDGYGSTDYSVENKHNNENDYLYGYKYDYSDSDNNYNYNENNLYGCEYCEYGEYTCEYCRYEEDPEILESSITFVKSGALIIQMHELYGAMDTNALLLRGVSAYDEEGRELTPYITVKDDGGFAEYIANYFYNITTPADENPGEISGDLHPLMSGFGFGGGFPVIQPEGYAFETMVTYAVIHPEIDKEFVSDYRDVRVLFMGVAPMGNVTSWDDLALVISLAQSGDVLDIYIMNDFDANGPAITIPAGVTVNLRSYTSSPNTYSITQNIEGVLYSGILHNTGANSPIPLGGANYRHFDIAGGTLHLHDVILTRDSNLTGIGGGIHVRSVLCMQTWVTFIGRLEMYDGAVIEHGTAIRGGGVSLEATSMFIMHGGTIRYNHAVMDTGRALSAGNPTIPCGRGGGVGGIVNSQFFMHGGEIRHNTAEFNGGGVWLGGSGNSLFWNNPARFVEFTGGIIRNNIATGHYYSATHRINAQGALIDNVLYGWHGGNAGGVELRNPGTFNMSGNASIVNNEVVTLIRDGSPSGGWAGGLSLQSANNVPITFNMSGSASISGNIGAHEGGGVFISQITNANPQILVHKINMSGNATISNNIVDGRGIVASTRFGRGGGMALGMNTTLTMEDNATISGNRIYGTLYGNGVGGGGVFIHGGRESVIRMYDDSSIKNNQIDRIPGHSTHRIINRYTSLGGGVFLNSGSRLYLNDNARINDNSAGAHGGGVWVDQGTSTVINLHSIFTMNGGEVRGNEAVRGGGGIGASWRVGTTLHPRIIINDGLITENEAAFGGGVFLYHNAELIMNGGQIVNNNAIEHLGWNYYTFDGIPFGQPNDTLGILGDRHGGLRGSGMGVGGLGGGIYAATFPNSMANMLTPLPSSVTINYGIISGNTAVNNGGGVWVGGNFVMHDGEISNNQTTTGLGNGGGIFVYSGLRAGTQSYQAQGRLDVVRGIATVNGGTISGNTATNHGGGVFVKAGSRTTTAGDRAHTGTGNTPIGTTLHFNATFTMNSGSITNNTADGNGGGIFTVRYQDLTTGNAVMFSGNAASSSHDFEQYTTYPLGPVAALSSGGGLGGDIGNIAHPAGSVSTLLYTHPLNNFDINFTGAATTQVVTFNPNGGTFTGGNQLPTREILRNEPTYTYSQAFETAGNNGNLVNPGLAAPTRTNYTFGGWFNSLEEANYLISQDGRVFPTTVVTDTDARTLYARWIPRMQMVIFNPNGGTFEGYLSAPWPTRYVQHGGTYTQAFDANDNLVNPELMRPIRPGFAFTGWFTQQTSLLPTLNRLQHTAAVTTAEERTLWARWAAHANIDIVFNVNHGEPADTVTRNVQFHSTFGAAKDYADVTALEYRTGFTFGGWFETQAYANGTTQDGLVNPTTLVENAGGYTLYARWSVIPTLTLTPNTVTVSDTQLEVTSAVSGTVTGTITLDTSALPAGVTATVNQATGVITVTGARPPAGSSAITGTFEVLVTREGLTETLVVHVNLTPLSGNVTGGNGGGGTPPTEIELPEVPLGPFIQDHIGYVRGFPEGDFRPGNSITRAEMSMILFRLLDSPNKYLPRTNNFSDVSTGWYAQAVSYLASRNIVTGYPDGTFRPNAPITRAELTAVMSRFFELQETDNVSFTDVSGSHWAIAYINNAVARGWVIGYEDDTFRPENSTTRAEAVTILNRVLVRRPNPTTVHYHLDGKQLFTDVFGSHWAFYDIMEAAIDHEYTLGEDGLEIWSSIYIPWLTVN